MRWMCICLLAAGWVMAQPAADTQPATQPTRNLSRYYNLVKNEFMVDADDRVAPLSKEVRQAIEQIREDAAREKRDIDAEIRTLRREIAQADAARRAEEQRARDESRRAKASRRRSVSHTVHRDAVGGVGRVSRSFNPAAAAHAERARSKADRARAAAAAAKGDISDLRAELLTLTSESRALAPVASPYNRNVPPKPYWSELPEDLQDQMARVGITDDQFGRLLETCGLSEDEFLDLAEAADADTRRKDDLVAKLVEMLVDRMPEAPASAPAGKLP